MLAILDHTEHRHINMHTGQHRQHRVHLGVAAVQQNQIRQDLKGTVLRVLPVMGKTPLQYLLHGPHIILAVKAFNGKFFIRFLHGAAVVKHHHTCHIIRTKGVRNIIGLNIFRCLGQSQQLRQLLQGGELSP